MREVKLIRDGLEPRHDGETLSTVDGPLHCVLLVNKLYEEAAEVAGSLDDAGEYADVLQVLRDLAWVNGVPWWRVQNELFRKLRARGGFVGGKVMTRTK